MKNHLIKILVYNKGEIMKKNSSSIITIVLVFVIIIISMVVINIQNNNNYLRESYVSCRNYWLQGGRSSFVQGAEINHPHPRDCSEYLEDLILPEWFN